MIVSLALAGKIGLDCGCYVNCWLLPLPGPLGRTRHRIDGAGRRAIAAAVLRGRHRKGVAENSLDHPAIGGRGETVADAEIDVDHAELEVGHRKQGMLLIGKTGKATDLAEVGVVFEAHKKVLVELSRQA